MAEFVNAGDMVEGARCEVYTRKWLCKGLREDPITHSNMMAYELDRNCSVEIVEKMSLSDNELQIRTEKMVHVNVGDKLKADAITLYVETKRKIKFEVKEGMTATHGGSLASTRKRTVGEIKYPFPNIQNKFMLLPKDKKTIKSITL